MKITVKLKPRLLLRAFYLLLTLCTALWAIPRRADAQLYVSQESSGIVSEYNLSTGKLINANFITGLTQPNALVLSGNDLLVANAGGSVGKYNATTGAAISQSFITGTDFVPVGLALSGDDLLVASSGSGTIGKYNVRTGKAIRASFITGLPLGGTLGLGVLGRGLYVGITNESQVAKYVVTTGKHIGSVSVTSAYGIAFLPGIVLAGSADSSGTIGEYNASTGATINASFITGLSTPYQIARVGTKLFVTNSAAGTVGEYDAETGVVINASFISGLTDPVGLAARR
jgi:WD40 repeat protein